MDLTETLSAEFVDRHAARARSICSARASDPAHRAGAEVDAERAFADFLADPAHLAAVDREIAREGLPAQRRIILEDWRRLFTSQALAGEAAVLHHEIANLESRHRAMRLNATLGYRSPATGEFVRSSFGELSSLVMSDPSPDVRHAAWQGLRDHERQLVEGGLAEIVCKRNALSRVLGYEDFYDLTVRRREGFGKRDLFTLLDAVVARTGPRCEEFVADAVRHHGNGARDGWNFGYLTHGRDVSKLDHYFSFDRAMHVWGQSLADLGVTFAGAHLRLDLVNRPGKEENGFTELITPAAPERGAAARLYLSIGAPAGDAGSWRALGTLLHEGGHAAHFCNVRAPAPSFSYPLAGSHAEAQAVFFERLTWTPEWMVAHGRDATGAPMPVDIVAETFRDHHRNRAFHVRNLLGVPYAERALYELPDTALTTDRILELSAETDGRMLGLASSSHPLFTLPHIYETESSAYFHSYVLAELAAEQMVAYLEREGGGSVHNRAAGQRLAERCWSAGNARSIAQMVDEFTGHTFSADDLLAAIDRPSDVAVEDALRRIAIADTIPRPRASASEHSFDATFELIEETGRLDSVHAGWSFERAADEFRRQCRHSRRYPL